MMSVGRVAVVGVLVGMESHHCGAEIEEAYCLTTGTDNFRCASFRFRGSLSRS